jgi:Protein of unknown function (DUF4230)
VTTTIQRFGLASSLAVALTVGAGLTWLLLPRPEVLPPRLVNLENMGHLVSVKVNYANVIEFTLPRAVGIPMTDWEVRYAGTTVLLVARGDCSVATDLRLAKYEAVDPKNRRLTVLLRTPATLDARVSHSPPNQGGSQLFAIMNNGIEALIPDQENRIEAIDGAFARAETQVAAACTKSFVIDSARRNTENVLRGVYEATGWDAAINWK